MPPSVSPPVTPSRQTPPADPALLTHEDILALNQAALRQRRRRLWLNVLTGVALLAGAGFGALPALHAVKAWQARRLAASARQHLDKDQWLDARKDITDASMIWRNEPEVLRVTALFLNRVGNYRQALTYWQQLGQVSALTAGDQRDYAAAELGLGNLDAAEARLHQVWPVGTPGTPADWPLGIQLAMRRERPAEAAALARRLLAAPAQSERARLSAATALLSTDESPEAHGLAWNAIKTVADGNRSPESLEALLTMARVTTAAPPAQLAKEGLPPLAELARRIDAHPLAQVAQHLLVLDLRAGADPASRPALIQEAIDRFAGTRDDASLATLASWLYGKGEYEKVLAILPPDRASGDRALFLQRLDTLGALGRWKDIRELIQSRKFPLDPMSAQMYLARCAEQLGEPAVRDACWNAAFDAAGTDPAKLLVVGQYAEKNGAVNIANKAIPAAVALAPDLREANEALFRLLEATGRTRDLHDALLAYAVHDPDDRALRNDIAYFNALLNVDVPAARDMARQLVQAEPASLPHRTVLALAELRLGNGLAAMDAFRGVKLPPPAAMQPRQQAVFATVLWKTSYEHEAREIVRIIVPERLLPEERELIRPLSETSAP